MFSNHPLYLYGLDVRSAEEGEQVRLTVHSHVEHQGLQVKELPNHIGLTPTPTEGQF